jgi:hypothetical protein
MLRLVEFTARLTAWQYFMSHSGEAFGRNRGTRAANMLLTGACGLVLPFLLLAGNNSSLIEFLGGFAGLDEAKPVVEDFLEAGRVNDTEAASLLTADPAVLRPQIVQLFQIRYLFEGYESVGIEGWHRQFTSGMPDSFRMNGKVRYESGRDGVFEAVLWKVDGVWRIANIQIYRPPP